MKNSGLTNRLVSLDAYRKLKASAHSFVLPTRFLADHRIAFLACAEHHDARALCLLLNDRPNPAALHHLSALIFRHYADRDGLSRLRFIWAHLNDGTAKEHTVHMNTTNFFRAMIEAFYRDHAKEIHGNIAGRFSVVDDATLIVELFHALGYEQRYNAILETYNASLHRRDDTDRNLVERQNAPIANR